MAVVYIPLHLGGYEHVLNQVPDSKLELPSNLHLSYTTLALGSALALWLYPHALTGTFSAKSGDVIRRNSFLLPIYTVMLLLLALLGYMAIVAAVRPSGSYGANVIIPALFEQTLPAALAGFALAAIAIDGLVPAQIMSIAAANLFSRNVYKSFLKPDAGERELTKVSKLTSLVVKLGGSPSSSPCPRPTSSTSSSRAVSGSCRRFRRSSLLSSSGPSIAGPSSSAGHSASPGALRCSPIPASTTPQPLRHPRRPARLHRPALTRAQPRRRRRGNCPCRLCEASPPGSRWAPLVGSPRCRRTERPPCHSAGQARAGGESTTGPLAPSATRSRLAIIRSNAHAMVISLSANRRNSEDERR